MNPQDEIAELENLIDQIIDKLQEIVQSGEILSDEFQGQIAQELGATMQRIEQLSSAAPQSPTANPIQETQPTQATGATTPTPSIGEGALPIGGQIPPLENAPYESSNIHAFRYEPKSQKLYVKFQGKDVANAGPVYSYEGVPPFIFDVFKRGAVGPVTSGSNKWHTWRKDVLPSHGAAMYHLIKAGGYPYQRLS